MSHFQQLSRLLDIEREAEIEQNKLELERFPAALREQAGKTVTRLWAESAGPMGGGIPVLKLSRRSAGEEISPFHAMNRGDLVSVEAPAGQRLDGTLMDVGEFDIQVAMNAALPEKLPGGRWSVHLIGSDATYKRMKRALEEAPRLGPKASRLRDVLLGERAAEIGELGEVSFRNPALNEFQKEAVLAALAARDAALIHGPPGTGKTTVLVEVITQAARAGKRVLATAPSNIAVDNMLEKLLPLGLRLVRAGHPARTLEALRHATLAFQIHEHPEYKRIRDLDLERERLMRQRSRRADRVQLGWEERHERQRDIGRLWREARDIEEAIVRELIGGAQVVLSTHGSIGRLLSRQSFDLAVLDEASQATEPLSWVAVLRAKKAVFAGDPMQLAPTLYSESAAKQGLAVTMFERLMPILPEEAKKMLRVQYRMHEAIMDFPSRRFYGGKLIADESVRAHLLCELPGVAQTRLTERPVSFVDTAGTGYQESWDEWLQSRRNDEEASLVARLLRELLEAGLPPSSAAVLTPYVAQVRALKALVPAAVEVGTVDGFQGREKEAVLLSLVRSNDQGEIGFLEDGRRLNVALTRARRGLIVVGDSGTVAAQPLFADLLEHFEKTGAHRSAWDWIDLKPS